MCRRGSGKHISYGVVAESELRGEGGGGGSHERGALWRDGEEKQ